MARIGKRINRKPSSSLSWADSPARGPVWPSLPPFSLVVGWLGAAQKPSSPSPWAIRLARPSLARSRPPFPSPLWAAWQPTQRGPAASARGRDVRVRLVRADGFWPPPLRAGPARKPWKIAPCSSPPIPQRPFFSHLAQLALLASRPCKIAAATIVEVSSSPSSPFPSPSSPLFFPVARGMARGPPVSPARSGVRSPRPALGAASPLGRGPCASGLRRSAMGRGPCASGLRRSAMGARPLRARPPFPFFPASVWLACPPAAPGSPGTACPPQPRLGFARGRGGLPARGRPGPSLARSLAWRRSSPAPNLAWRRSSPAPSSAVAAQLACSPARPRWLEFGHGAPPRPARFVRVARSRRRGVACSRASQLARGSPLALLVAASFTRSCVRQRSATPLAHSRSLLARTTPNHHA
jgi:hypothetical protein